MTEFELVSGRRPSTMLEAMFPRAEDDDLNDYIIEYLWRVEEARQLAGVHPTDQQLGDAERYKL